ncbi:MAG: CYTH domain-containing protein [Paludibacteraceae bacterium]|nr:CYTH domain-containing protein [Paludibacteraceae bacterium]
MQNLEIERKFLVTDAGCLEQALTHYDIIQGYVCREPGKTVRLRLRTDADGSQKAFLTFKHKIASFTRFEWEREITVDDFHALLPMCGNRFIDKTRYILPAESLANGQQPTADSHLKWEIDVFRHPNAGLILAEIELPDEQTPFVKPAFLGEEVTNDPRYYNANML